ncbi:hypothetical protein DOY81_007596 [Sarcophaga bullata]|nr:hypothetical protein DOY81_007596 [Sarcophaga bullata]
MEVHIKQLIVKGESTVRKITKTPGNQKMSDASDELISLAAKRLHQPLDECDAGGINLEERTSLKGF